jgi:hypothetical protein
MSGESSQHIKLVERLITIVEDRHRTSRGILIFADHRKFGDGQQPPMIGGYKPDLFAQDLPETFRLIGEAKTQNDLEQERSALQIAAFLDHLALRPNGGLYLAVPWFLKGRMHHMVRELRTEAHAAVQVHVFPITA